MSRVMTLQQIQHGGVARHDHLFRLSPLLPETPQSIRQRPPRQLLHLPPFHRIIRRLDAGDHIRSKDSLGIGAHIFALLYAPAVIPLHGNGGGAQIGDDQLFSQKLPRSPPLLRLKRGSDYLHFFFQTAAGRASAAARTHLTSVSPISHVILPLSRSADS